MDALKNHQKNSRWLLAAVMVGGSIGGSVGMLLGVPAASAAYTLLREATQKRELMLKKRQARRKKGSENDSI